MKPRLALTLVPLAVVLAVVAACGGGDDDDGSVGGGTGQITDPRSVPTATAWPEAPEPITLDPDNLTPVSGGEGVGTPDGDGDGNGDEPNGDGNGDNGDNGDSGPPPGECGGPTYTIEAGDTIVAIAEKCGLSSDDILAANPGVDPGALSIGQVINLPTGDSGDTEGEE